MNPATQAIIDFLLKIVTAIGKQAAIQATPAGIAVGESLGETLAVTVRVAFDPQLKAAEKADLYHEAWENIEQIVATAEREGAELASEIATLVADAAASDIKTALGIPN